MQITSQACHVDVMLLNITESESTLNASRTLSQYGICCRPPSYRTAALAAVAGVPVPIPVLPPARSMSPLTARSMSPLTARLLLLMMLMLRSPVACQVRAGRRCCFRCLLLLLFSQGIRQSSILRELSAYQRHKRLRQQLLLRRRQDCSGTLLLLLP
jgi:hypothetical protein